MVTSDVECLSTLTSIHQFLGSEISALKATATSASRANKELDYVEEVSRLKAAMKSWTKASPNLSDRVRPRVRIHRTIHILRRSLRTPSLSIVSANGEVEGLCPNQTR